MYTYLFVILRIVYFFFLFHFLCLFCFSSLHLNSLYRNVLCARWAHVRVISSSLERLSDILRKIHKRTINYFFFGIFLMKMMEIIASVQANGFSGTSGKEEKQPIRRSTTVHRLNQISVFLADGWLLVFRFFFCFFSSHLDK